MNWQTYFDWIPVVNLARRPERWTAFTDRLATVKDWPFRMPERYEAVDGSIVGAPLWLKAGPGAWGCAQSHLQILQTAMHRGYQRILVLEDDAVFCPDFTARAFQYIEALPANWHQAYFGGQHLRTKVREPKPVNSFVVRPFNVNRTHAYALQREFYKPLYQWLVDYVNWSKVPQHHVDHYMGRLHETGRYNIYAPTHFLVGQADGASDITSSEQPLRFWDEPKGAHGLVKLPPFVAIIGVHRSGSSMLAWMLQKLGVHMGHSLNGNCEARNLQALCERLYPFGAVKPTGALPIIAKSMKGYVKERTLTAAKLRTMPGGKYPTLCAMRDLLLDACQWGLKIIHIERPMEDSIASLITRVREDRLRRIKWLGIPDDAAKSVQLWLNKEKQCYFDGTIPTSNILHVKYYDVLNNPAVEIKRIVDFLGLKPTPAAVAAAQAVVMPKKRRHVNGRLIKA